MLVSVLTKLDETFPTRQFLIEGFSVPYRLYRNIYGGILICVRESIPSKELKKHKFHEYIEINLRKN